MLTVFPRAGLGNRLLALTSAQVLAEHVGCPLRVIWRSDPLFGRCDYPVSALFEGLDTIPEIPNHSEFGFIHYHREGGPAPELEARLRAGQDVLLDSYAMIQPAAMNADEFGEKLHRQFAALKPAPELLAALPAVPANAIGIQVRRQDHWRATRYSPTALFFQVMDYYCDRNTETAFYLASDSSVVRRQMNQRYGRRIVSHQLAAASDPWRMAQAALIDILGLARTRRLYISYWSTFGFIAHLFSRNPYDYLCLPSAPPGWHDSAADRRHDHLIAWNSFTNSWQLAPLSDRSVLTNLKARAELCWSNFVCSDYFQRWPFHRFRPIRIDGADS